MDREADLLPVPYFHVVFTLPEELNMVAFHNQSTVYDILFRSSKETLKELALDKKYLGAKIGFISILHTWGQNLTLHPHVHMIVPGGGLTRDGKFLRSKKKFFIPVKVLSKKFRGKFLFYLNQAKPNLSYFTQESNPESSWLELVNELYRKNWYVYCKRPFKTTRSVLQYLGRYTHRIAISNHRILSTGDGKVAFKWRDYRDGKKEKVMTLSADEFIRRFLLHVLPPGFTKIRHYGILSSAVKKTKLVLCKKLAGVKVVLKRPLKLTIIEFMQKLTGRDITLCPCCGVGHFIPCMGLSPPG